MRVMRYRIDLSYEGADFCGWQIQPQEPSVQEALEKALGTLLRSKIQVTGAGRTDTGVSASCYVAHFDFDGPVPPPLQVCGSGEVDGKENVRPESVPPLQTCGGREVDGNEEARSESAHPLQVCGDMSAADNSKAGQVPQVDCKQLRYKLNAILPKSVSINSITAAAPDFHARFGAIRRQYTYYLHRCKDPFCERYSYLFAYPEFNVDAMNRAARLLLGTHDFSCFEKSGGDNKTSVCTVFCARWEPYLPVIHARTIPGDPRYWRFVIEADRFLRNMVRAIVGTLLEVGRGRRSEAYFAALILTPGTVASADAPAATGYTPDAGSSSAGTPAATGNTTVAGSSSADAPAATGKPVSAAAKVSRRSEAGESVPGHALFLSGIQYP